MNTDPSSHLVCSSDDDRMFVLLLSFYPNFLLLIHLLFDPTLDNFNYKYESRCLYNRPSSLIWPLLSSYRVWSSADA